MKGFGLASLSGARRGYMPPQLKTIVTIFREPDLNTHNSIQTLIFRCMIGWQDEAKTLFLGTVLSSGIMSLILMLVVLCNIHTSALRKKIFVQELSSLSRGLFFLTLIFALTWSWYPLTYFKLQHLELPDFYPAFQIVNSWMGVFTFVGIGLGSKRFRHAIKSISKRH